ncbi:unnamed protein product [Mycena citricolor]|uniref:DUF3533 domain-containing protein n=1 Tax=Mycena citricolor TaxID=2018698 RepID=A0AAD2HWR9_9AGAR|nr:unnamed protein product [Mycena citricolor]CAK5283581.1 unnamed protein product [Mycena citricolor]
MDVGTVATTSGTSADGLRPLSPSRESDVTFAPTVPPMEPAGHRVPVFTASVFDKTPSAAASLKQYLRIMVAGVLAISFIIFGVFSIYWGSVWSTPRYAVDGWIVDFDGGQIGAAVSSAISSIPSGRGIAWKILPAAQFPGGVADLEAAVKQEKMFYGLAINAGATANYTSALASASASYDGSNAIWFIGAEARNQNVYPIHLQIMTGELSSLTQRMARQMANNLTRNGNINTILTSAPQLVTDPVGYTVDNVIPFDIPVATAVTFVGLIYLLILSFFVVVMSAGARTAAGYEQTLKLRSIVLLRFASSFVSYFFISLFYTLLSRAFQVSYSRHFGQAGFVIFWFLNWMSMCATGLALEAMITLLTIQFIPFFLLLWIISNVSTCVFPIEILPHVYRYGYAWPFYNVEKAVRAIIFGTKNDIGLNFGVLLAWIAVSLITMPLFQFLARRRAFKAAAIATADGPSEKS